MYIQPHILLLQNALLDDWHFGLMEVKISLFFLVSNWRVVYYRFSSPPTETEKWRYLDQKRLPYVPVKNKYIERSP